uniref:Uncharacterized protein n=1 Tax=Glossina pallidipes TaxID=7398 RepID=A0A1B0A2C9_GLOPL
MLWCSINATLDVKNIVLVLVGMGDQLFHNVVPLLNGFFSERNVFQITTNGGQETRRQQFSDGGESFQGVVNKSVELLRHKEILKSTEEFSSGSEEFRSEQLFESGPVFVDIFESVFHFSREELSKLLENLVDEVLEEFVETAKVFKDISGVFLDKSGRTYGEGQNGYSEQSEEFHDVLFGVVSLKTSEELIPVS